MRSGTGLFSVFKRKYPTEEACQKLLFQLRWPLGYRCPRCQHDQAYFHRQRHLYGCKACNYQTSLTAGTIFHKTRTPLRKWFAMIFLMGNQKRGVSIPSLQRILKIRTYKTAWVMAHKIRQAMAESDTFFKLAGLINGNDTSLGTKIGPQQTESRLERLDRLKQAIDEGTYQIDAKKLANILIFKTIFQTLPSDEK